MTDSLPEGFVPPPRGEDLPCDDGEPMESERHREQMWLLIKSLQYHMESLGRRDVYVAGNMFIYFSETQARRNDFRGPDVFVVLETDDHERKSWVVWEEGGRTPDVIIELTSASTEHVDRGVKMDLYARVLHTAAYFLYDPFTERVEGFALDAAGRRYLPVPADARGFVRCEPLDLWLGVRETRAGHVRAPMLRWFDAQGRVLPNDEERAAGAEERAAGAEERARAAEEELARLREELRRR